MAKYLSYISHPFFLKYSELVKKMVYHMSLLFWFVISQTSFIGAIFLYDMLSGGLRRGIQTNVVLLKIHSRGG